MCNCMSYNRPDLGGTEPEAVLDYAQYFPDTGRPKVCVDPCIAEMIESLWQDGIRTGGCCCSHNGKLGSAPSVYLDDPADAVRAFQLLSGDHRQWQVYFWAGEGIERRDG